MLHLNTHTHLIPSHDCSSWGYTCTIFCRYSPRCQTCCSKFCSRFVSPSPSHDGCGTDWSAAGSAGISRAALSAAPCSHMAPVLRASWATCDHTTLAILKKVTSGKNLQRASTAGMYFLTNSHKGLQLSMPNACYQNRIITEWMRFEHDKDEVTTWWETDNEEFHSLFCLPNTVNIY